MAAWSKASSPVPPIGVGVAGEVYNVGSQDNERTNLEVANTILALDSGRVNVTDQCVASLFDRRNPIFCASSPSASTRASAGAPHP